MEQQERKRRAMMNKEVRAFAEKVAEAASSSVGVSMLCKQRGSFMAGLAR